MEESAANDVRMKSIIYCFIAVLLLTSCGGTQSLPTTQLPKAVTSSPIISTKISTPTISPSTPSKTSLQTKDVTATQKTEPFLTKRNPSLKELNDYLQKNL